MLSSTPSRWRIAWPARPPDAVSSRISFIRASHCRSPTRETNGSSPGTAGFSDRASIAMVFTIAIPPYRSLYSRPSRLAFARRGITDARWLHIGVIAWNPMLQPASGGRDQRASGLIPRQPPDRGCIRILCAVTQQVVRQHAGHHRLADRHRSDADARIVPTLGDDLDVMAGAIDRVAW